MLTSVFIAAVSLALFWMAAFTLWWQMHAWRTPEVLASTRFSSPDGDEHVSFSLLLPARHEQAVLDGVLSVNLDGRRDAAAIARGSRVDHHRVVDARQRRLQQNRVRRGAGNVEDDGVRAEGGIRIDDITVVDPDAMQPLGKSYKVQLGKKNIVVVRDTSEAGTGS